MYISRLKSQIFKNLRNLLVKFLGNKNPTKKDKTGVIKSTEAVTGQPN